MLIVLYFLGSIVAQYQIEPQVGPVQACHASQACEVVMDPEGTIYLEWDLDRM